MAKTDKIQEMCVSEGNNVQIDRTAGLNLLIRESIDRRSCNYWRGDRISGDLKTIFHFL